MPHSKDLRCGAGWYDINLSHFFEWMEEFSHSEIEVSENFTPFSRAEYQYHERVLHDEIEERMNEFLDYRIFNQFRPHLDEDDRLPKDFESAYSYIYYHILRLCKARPTWYSVRPYTSECCAEPEPKTAKPKFVIDSDTLTLSCPDGTTKEMEMTDHETEKDGNEYYAESQDVGIFYFPKSGRVWAQGLAPTYEWEVLTNDVDITILEPKPKPKTAKKSMAQAWADASREDNLKEKAEAVAKEVLDKVFASVPEDQETKRQKARAYVTEKMKTIDYASQSGGVGDALVSLNNFHDGVLLYKIDDVTLNTVTTLTTHAPRKVWRRAEFVSREAPNGKYKNYKILKWEDVNEVAKIMGETSGFYNL